MHGQKLKIFKRPKNREDGSDFDGIQTKKIAAAQAVWWKKWNERNKRKVPEKFEKLSKKFSKLLKIDIADVINY